MAAHRGVAKPTALQQFTCSPYRIHPSTIHPWCAPTSRSGCRRTVPASFQFRGLVEFEFVEDYLRPQRPVQAFDRHRQQEIPLQARPEHTCRELLRTPRLPIDHPPRLTDPRRVCVGAPLTPLNRPRRSRQRSGRVPHIGGHGAAADTREHPAATADAECRPSPPATLPHRSPGAPSAGSPPADPRPAASSTSSPAVPPSPHDRPATRPRPARGGMHRRQPHTLRRLRQIRVLIQRPRRIFRSRQRRVKEPAPPGITKRANHRPRSAERPHPCFAPSISDHRLRHRGAAGALATPERPATGRASRCRG